MHAKNLQNTWNYDLDKDLDAKLNIVSQYFQWPLLLMWFNFNPSMDKW